MENGINRRTVARTGQRGPRKNRARNNLITQISPEHKFRDVGLNVAADTTGGVQILNSLFQGTSPSTRIGRLVLFKKFYLNLTDRVTPGTGTDQIHRILIFVDHQTNGAAPAITDVLQSAVYDAFPNLYNEARFRILYDSTRSLNATAEPGSIVITTRTLRSNVLTTFNDGNAGSVADINTNSVYILCLGNNAPGATAGTLGGNVRMYFVDA